MVLLMIQLDGIDHELERRSEFHYLSVVDGIDHDQSDMDSRRVYQ